MNKYTCDELHKRWQESVNDIVQRLTDGEKFSTLCKEYVFERHNYGRWLEQNGYRTRRKSAKRVIIPDDQLAKAYRLITEEQYSMQQVAKIIGHSYPTVSKRLWEVYQCKTLPDGKRPVNDHYFDNIDTAEKAYWLGFLLADGTVSDKYRIEFCLQDQDKYAVENFREAINSKHDICKKVVRRFVNWRISFCSKAMAEALATLGCWPRKTYNKILPIINQSLYSHFMRGYVDGNGSTHLSYCNSLTVQITTGSQIFAQQLQELLYQYDIICCIKQDQRTVSTYRIDFNLINSGKLLDWCYQDSTEKTRLYRKYEKYLKAKNCRPQSNVTEDCG